MSVYRPSWTHGGPYDARSDVTLSTSQAQVAELVEAGSVSTRDPDRWFFAAERLATAFPEWPWAKVRLAHAHLLLEDADGALDLLEQARRLAEAPDEVFDEWLKQFRVKVEEERAVEDHSWSEPEDGGVIVQPWNPPRDLSSFSLPGSSLSSPILEKWNAYKESLGADTAAKRYSRLVAVQSSELEGVFTLGGEPLSSIVRNGVTTEAIDEVVQGLPSGVDGVVEVLRDFDKCLEAFASSAPGDSLMQSSRIGYVEFPGEAPIPYLKTVGQYRRRIVTASMECEDTENNEGEHENQNEDQDQSGEDEDEEDDNDEEDEDETWGVVQFARHQEVEAHMTTFLEMVNAKLAQGELKVHDPFVFAAWILHNLATIHPFADGNGRVVRILASLPLLKAGLPYINIRPDVKLAYLRASHKAATDEDLGPLAELIAMEMRESISWLRNIPAH